MGMMIAGKPNLEVCEELGRWYVKNTQGTMTTWFCDITKQWFANYRSNHPMDALVFSEDLSQRLWFKEKREADGIIQQARRYKTTIILNKVRMMKAADLIRRLHE